MHPDQKVCAPIPVVYKPLKLNASRIIDDAEERLGIRAAREEAAAKQKEFYARLAEEERLEAERVSARRGVSIQRKLSGKLPNHLFLR